MMVGLMGRAALISISSRVMPITDRSTMARSSWFHLKQTHLGVAAYELPRYHCQAPSIKILHSCVMMMATAVCI